MATILLSILLGGNLKRMCSIWMRCGSYNCCDIHGKKLAGFTRNKLAAIACVFSMIFATEVIAQVPYLGFDASDSASAKISLGDVTSNAQNSLRISSERNNTQLNPQEELTPIRLTNNSAESTDPRAVVDNSFLYVVWRDTRDGNPEIYWQKFDRSMGSAATSPIRVTNSGAASFDPSIGVDGSGNSYIVWQEGSQYGTIQGVKLDGNGAPLFAIKNLSPGLSLHPDIAANSSGVNWVTYQRMANVADQNVYVRKGGDQLNQICLSPTSGTIWGAVKMPVIGTDGTNGWVAYYDEGDGAARFLKLEAFGANCNKFGQANQDQAYTRPAIGSSNTEIWIAIEKSENIYNVVGPNNARQINDNPGTASYPRVEADPNYAYFVWQDSRDGNLEIYLSKATGSQDLPDQRITNNPFSSQHPDIATYPAEPGKFWIVWQDNRDGNWEIYLTTSNPQPSSLIILDGAEPPQPIVNHACKIYGINGQTQELKAEVMSDNNGIVSVDPGWFTIGDNVRVEILAYTFPSTRPFHDAVDGVGHAVYLDNATVHSDAPFSYDDVFTGQALQPITLTHALVKFNLVAITEWDANQQQLTNLSDAFRLVANHLLDVTDGQATLGKVMIYDKGKHPSNGALLEAADLKFRSTNSLQAGASRGYMGNEGGCAKGGIDLSRTIYSNDKYFQSMLHLRYGFDWTLRDASIPLLTSSHYPGVRAISHELAHYFFYFGDEYRYDIPGSKKVCPAPPPSYDFGLMSLGSFNNEDEPLYGEMSSQQDYDNAGSTNTSQWCSWSMSCWDWFENRYEGTLWEAYMHDSLGNQCGLDVQTPFVRIVKPSERTNSSQPFSGPNNDLSNPDENVGASVAIDLSDSPGSLEDLNISTRGGSWMRNQENFPIIDVYLSKSGDWNGSLLYQGTTSKGGTLVVVEAVPGDTLLLSGRKGSSSLANGSYLFLRQEIGSFTAAETLQVVPSLIAPPSGLIVTLEASGQQQFQLIVDSDSLLLNPPVMKLIGSGDLRHYETLSQTLDGYLSTADVFSGEEGIVLVDCTMVDSTEFSVPINYRWASSQSPNYLTLQSPDNLCNVSLDSLASSQVDYALVYLSDFEALERGIPEHTRLIGNTYGTSFVQIGETAPAYNLSLFVSIEDSVSTIVEQLTLYHWNTGLRAWEAITAYGTLDGSLFVIRLTQTGLFQLTAALRGFMCGDANGDGAVDIADAVYLIAYIFSRGPEPSPLAAGDTDCSGDINIADCVYLISYIFSHGAAPCEACK